jgi:hypothetical protein
MTDVMSNAVLSRACGATARPHRKHSYLSSVTYISPINSKLFYVNQQATVFHNYGFPTHGAQAVFNQILQNSIPPPDPVTDRSKAQPLLLLLPSSLQMSNKRVAYYYDNDVGLYTYSTGHPMKPHRMRITHDLISAYGMLDKMHVLVLFCSLEACCKPY